VCGCILGITGLTQKHFDSIGGGLGILTGLFFGALENPITTEEMSARQQIVYQAKQMGRRSIISAKTFAVMGLIFSAAECVVEKVYISVYVPIHEYMYMFPTYFDFAALAGSGKA
jgi:hypothetical protein